jgi:hypothetical protein
VYFLPICIVRVQRNLIRQTLTENRCLSIQTTTQYLFKQNHLSPITWKRQICADPHTVQRKENINHHGIPSIQPTPCNALYLPIELRYQILKYAFLATCSPTTPTGSYNSSDIQVAFCCKAWCGSCRTPVASPAALGLSCVYI